MINLETIMDHLGPTASPLMALLDVVDAKNLLVVSKYVSSRVSAYSNRWGFKVPPYMEYADGSFAVTIRGLTKKFKPLKKYQSLKIDTVPPRSLLDYRTHALVISQSSHVVYGTRSDIKDILKCAKPYMLKRELRLKQEAIEAAKQKELDDASAARAAYLAKYSIKAIGPPTYPWGKKASA